MNMDVVFVALNSPGPQLSAVFCVPPGVSETVTVPVPGIGSVCTTLRLVQVVPPGGVPRQSTSVPVWKESLVTPQVAVSSGSQ